MAWTPFLFITTVNPLLEVEGRSAEVTSGDSTRHPACREFMDDVIMMTSSIQLMNLTKNTFSIQRSEILTQEQGIRCFGKNYESSLKDTANLGDTKAQLSTGSWQQLGWFSFNVCLTVCDEVQNSSSLKPHPALLGLS